MKVSRPVDGARADDLVRRLPLVLIAALVPFYLYQLLAPAVGYYHDDGIYLTNALSLASGQGYKTISLPDAPAQTKYPPLYSVLLAILWRCFPRFPDNVLIMKLLSTASIAVWGVLLYRWLLRETNHVAVSRWIVFLALMSPWAFHTGVSILPDALFATLSFFGVTQLNDAVERRSGSLFKVVTCALVVGAAYLVRTAGLPLIVGGTFILLYRGLKWQAASFAAVIALLTAPWVIWQLRQPVVTDPVESYYTRASYSGGQVFASRYTMSQKAAVVAVNAATLLINPTSIAPQFAGAVQLPIGLLVALLAIVGHWRSLRSRITIVNVWVFLYTSMLLCWLWYPTRYTLPAIPFYLLYAYLGARKLIPDRRLDWFWGLMLSYFVIASVLLAYQVISIRNKTETPAIAGVQYDEWSKVNPLIDWIAANTPKDSIVTSHYDGVVFLRTGRRGIRPFHADFYYLLYDPSVSPIGGLEQFKRHLRTHHVTHIMVTPMRSYIEYKIMDRILAELKGGSPNAIQVVHRLEDPAYYILRVDYARL